nr:putative e3 ubiquitin-protein ligase lul4 [Quercus suber]
MTMTRIPHSVSLTFNPLVDVSITIFYFATELANCTFTSVYPEIYVHWKIPFQKGPFSSESKSKCMWPAQEQIKLKLIKHHPKMGNYQFLCTGEKSTGLMGCYHSYSF